MKFILSLSALLFSMSALGAGEFYSRPGTKSPINKTPFSHYCHVSGDLESFPISSQLASPSRACAEHDMVAGIAVPKMFECSDGYGNVTKIVYSTLSEQEACE